MLIQDLWKEGRGWDDPIQPQSLADRWIAWEQELPHLIHLELPRSYTQPSTDTPTATRELHIFCDSSERAYSSVAYMRTVDDQQKIHVAFVLARSHVAPKKQLSMPRLELSDTLTGAELTKVLQTIPIFPSTKSYSGLTLPLFYIGSDLNPVGIRFL